MKKFIFLLAFFFLASFSFVSAQDLATPYPEVSLTKPGECAPHGYTKDDFVLKYITGNPGNALGANTVSGTRYSSGCINFTAGQMTNYVGGTITQINTGFASPASMVGLTDYKIWIKTALDGPIVYEQTVDWGTLPTTGYEWKEFPLDESYTILPNSALVIGFTATFYNDAAANQYALACSIAPDTYQSGGFNYINLSTIPTAHESGAIWSQYTGLGNLAIEALVTGVAPLPTNDLAASSVSTTALKWVDNQTTFAISVANTGTASQNNYTVQLIDATNTVLASQTVTTALAAGATANINVNYTPTEAGNIAFRGKVILAGDEVASNDISEPSTFRIYPQKPMAYCDHSPMGALGNATNTYTFWSTAIEYSTSNMTPYIGKMITSIEVGLGDVSIIDGNVTVWIRNSLSGANVVEQTFSPVEGWNVIELTEPYSLTNQATCIGYTFTPNGPGYAAAFTYNTPNIDAGRRYETNLSGGWISMAATINGHFAIIGVVESEPVGDCNPPTALNVTYESDCSATLTWTAPTGKSMSTPAVERKAKGERNTISKADFRSEMMKRAAMPKPTLPNAPNSKGILLSEDFDDPSIVFDLPDGWTELAGNMESWWWLVDDDSMWEEGNVGHNGSPQWAACWWEDEADYKDSWMITPGIAMTAGETYTISFWAIMGFDEDDGNNFKVKIAQSPTIAAMNASTVTAYSNTNCYFGNWTQLTYNFTPTATGTYYIGFNDNTDYYDGYDSFIDDVQVTSEDAPPSGDFTYNIYRDNMKINTEPVTTESYTDEGFNANVAHTWEVKAICETGGVSEPATKEMEACNQGAVVCDDYTIGTGTTSYFDLPTDTYPYSYNQQIYYASDIGFPSGGMIQSIAYQYTTATPLTRTMTLYMVNTDKASFANNSDWITTGLVQVYQGSFTFNNEGTDNWITIDLDTPFEYTGGNLVVAFLNSTGVSASAGTFRATDFGDQRTIHQWSSTVLVDPFNPVAGSSAFGYSNNITFNVCSDGGEPQIVCDDYDVVGTNTTAQYTVPINTFYRYSYIQQIYDEDEIGVIGDINSISFQYIYNVSQSNKPDQSVYIGHTTKNTFASATDWISLDDLTLVYSGSLDYNNSELWFTIPFDQPFTYTGGNLVVAVLNNHGDYTTSSYATFNTHTTTGSKAIWYRKDLTPAGPIDPSNPAGFNSGYTGTYSYTNHVQFNICSEGTNPPPGDCNPPQSLAVSYEPTTCDAILTWEPPTGKKSITNGPTATYEELLAKGLVEEKERRGERAKASNLALLTAKVEDKGKSSVVLSGGNNSKGQLLWDNTNINIPTSGNNGLISTYWAGEDTWVLTADDFIVDDQWIIEQFSTKGFEVWNLPTKMAVFIFQDNGNAPGAEIFRATGINVTLDYGSDMFYSCDVVLPTPIQLPEGKYWLAIAGEFAGGVDLYDNVWYIGEGTTPIESNFHLQDPGDLFGMGSEWFDAYTSGAAAPCRSMYFTIEGEIGSLCPTATNVTATANGNNVTVSWTAATGSPSGYEILRNGQSLTTVTSTTYTNTNVPDGQHTYGVKAIYTDGCYPITVNAPAIIVGDVCLADIITSSYNYGDSFSWWVKDNATNTPIIGAGSQSGFGSITTGTLTAMLTGDATFELWQHGTYTDNGVALSIVVNGTTVYSFSMDNIPASFTTSGAVPCEGGVNPPGDITYKVYRGTELLGTTTELTFTDTDWDHESATWNVTAVCEDGGESVPATVNGQECSTTCPTIQNLSVVYNAGCGAELTWDPAKGNSKACDDVQVGNGTSGTCRIPLNSFYKGSYSQQIYTAADLGNISGGTINSVAMEWFYGTPWTFNNVKIYVGHTTKNNFPSSQAASDWETPSALTLVYEGSSVTVNNSQTWTTFEFQTPFTYTGGNIVVAFLFGMNSGYQDSSPHWRTHTNSSPMNMFYQDDTNLFNINAPQAPTSGYSSDNLMRANTIFNICTGGGGGDKTFVITRDGDEIAQVTETYYSDYGFDYMTGHTWGVTAICSNGLESEEVTETLDACDAEGNCNPAQNLEGEYTMMCDIVLTWEPPVGKKMPTQPTKPSAERGNVQIITIPAGIEMTEAEKLEMMNMNTAERRAPTQPMSTPIEFQPAVPFRGDDSPLIYSVMFTGLYSTTLGQPGGTHPQISTLPYNISYQAMERVNDIIYVITYNDDTYANTFGTVDPVTGTFTTINSNCPTDAISMAWNPIDDQVYVSQWGGPSPFGKLNLTNGAFTSISSITGYVYMAIDNDGVCYAINGTSFGTINLTTGAFTAISTYTQNGSIQDLYIDRETNELYHINLSGQLMKMNKATGATTNLGTFNASQVESWIIISDMGDPCPAVSNVQASVVSGTQNVNITWVAATGNPTSTQVTRDGGVVATLAGTATSYSDENVTPGNHTYCVKAIYPAGDDCIPQNVCAAPVMVTEILEGGCEAVIVGNGTSEQYYYPIVTYYNYSYTQQIFDASELGIEDGNLITAISFNYIFGTPKSFPIEVYLANTSQSTFSGTGNFIPITELTSVFDDNVTINNSQNWYTIYIDPFIYTGENLVIAVVNKGHSYFSGNSFLVHNTTGDKGVRYYQDGGPINLNSPTSATLSGVGNTRNNVRFVVCEGAYSVKYNVYRDGTPIATTKELTYTDSGFDPTELHHWKVAVVCEDQTESAGIYLTKEACAGCYGPTDLEVEYTDDCEGAFLTWEDPIGKKSNNGTTIEKPVEYTFIPREGGMNTGNTLSIKNEKPVTLPTQSGGNNSKSEVLWDNTNINVGTGGLISAYWSGNDNWVWTADDFDADAPWIIEKVISQGFSNSPSALPTKMDVAIFADAAGHPGTEIYRNKAIPVTDGTNPEIILPTPFQLPAPGKYWIAIAGAYDATVTDNVQAGSYRWNIYHGTTPKGDVFQLYDKLGIFGSGASTWLDGSSLVAGSYSMYFRIEGQLGGDLCDPVTNLNATVKGKNVQLTWTAPAGGPIGYEIIRDGQSLTTVTTTTYTDTQVPDGFHTYGVKALFAGDCFPVVVNAPEVLVGDLCSVEVVVSYVQYGDEINWAIKDANGATLAGAGNQVNGSSISAGTFSTLFAGEATFRFWNGGGYGFGDNDITIAVNYDGNQIYYLDMADVPVGYNGGDIPFECISGTSFNFNIYRDGELVAEGINDLGYFDTGFDHSQSHTWCVVSICDDGSESLPACKEVAKCSCDPVENLNGYYDEDCNVVLSWDEATGKSIIYTPEDIEIDPVAEAANAALILAADQAKMAMENQRVSAPLSADRRPASAITGRHEVKNLPTQGGTRGNTAYGYIHYPESAIGYWKWDVDAINGKTLITTSLPVMYGGECFNETLYCYSNYLTGTEFYQINALTGAVISQTPRPELSAAPVNAVSYDYSSNTMYALYQNTLYTVNMTTGALTQVAPVSLSGGDALMMAIDLTGMIYMVNIGTANLYTINKSTGAATLVGSTGCSIGYAQAMAFDHTDGTLYWAESESVYDNWMKINTTTGAATMIQANTYETTCLHFNHQNNPNLVKAPTNFTATQVDNTFDVGLSWTNPSETIGGAALTNISQIVLERDGTPISTFNNPAVGGNMTFTDNVGENGTYSYTVYAVVGGENGLSASTSIKISVKLCDAKPTDVIIGNTDLSSSYGCPVFFYYNNSYTQQIYTVDEIGSGGTIVSIAYNYIFSTPKDVPYKIYMGNTTKSSFASSSAEEFIPLSAMTLVYEGTASFSATNPWSVIELDVPFKYEGENLVIATVANRGSGWTSSAHFKGGSVSPNRSIRCYQDGAAIDPNNLNATNNMFAVDPQLANVQFGICPAPYNIYEDGVLIEQNWQGNSYTYNATDPWNTHTYEVSVVCLNGKESPKAAITLEPCEYLERVSGYVFNCVTGLPMEGVTTTISYLDLETTTDATGFYTYPYVNCNKDHIVTGVMPGFYTNTTEPFFVECGDDNMAPDLCLQPIPEWLVYGDVRGCDDSYIVGAEVTLVSDITTNEHEYSFETTTGQFGQFEFPEVYMCQPGESYILTVTKPGWEVSETVVVVLGNTNVGRIILYDIPVETDTVLVVEAADYQSAIVTWPAAEFPEEGGAGILGYKLWRLIPGQEEDETLWSLLTNEPVDDLMFIDNAWANYAPGEYRYAVKTAYCSDLVSEPVFSDTIVKNIQVGFEIKITTECENNPLGAVVTLTNEDYQYQLPSTNTGAFFPKVWLGTYTLKITLAGYDTYTDSAVMVTAAGSYDALLKIAKKDPADLKVDTLGNTAHLTWSFDAVIPIAGFTIYLNDEVVKTGVTTTEYYFTNLADGDYKAEVEANYCATINSAKKAIEFTILTVGIDVYEFDYILYPNPTTELLTIQRSNACDATIELYNAMGKHISTYETTEHQLEINVGSLAVGTYFIRINEGDISVVKSFVKK